MKLSTKGRYGLKAMFQLALNESKGPVPLKYIAQRQNLSDQYLEQIFSSLRKAGLVKSIRGAQGGYLLSRDASKITVGDIIRVLEGPVAPSDCVLDDESDCKKSGHCVTQVVWEKIKESVESVIDSITLQNMIDDHKNKMKNINE
ncbi:RrF2 family transcriptional regulator [Tepidibacter formicigenes]|uniref:Transcriptional regulator, BadM/Rrf2 family n=1 Tax=Tepidibacter formicigenes DSM 15518 TaxID=1123349 RepID=A0A1M6PBV3_9FIRM|nr:Rrf2 family transcriptional regulator [Tepidibacter formicigenes]SHK05416.1 transcriptional regulator, BadM/Rrf2 family [Tepidibacter formicigenes DSM 15518]